MNMTAQILVSRCDRLGDLVLSLPALGFLRDAGLRGLFLHTSSYASPIGEWAQHNGLVEGVWAEGQPVPSMLAGAANTIAGLSLFHCPEAVRAFRHLGLRQTVGPRTKLNALWSYRYSVAQHRSRVEMSEMAYNVELAEILLRRIGRDVPVFRGLPALKIPENWISSHTAPDLLIVASNGGSAHNWPMARYLEVAREAIERDGKSVDFLIHGSDASERILAYEASGLAGRARLLPSFADLRSLIAHIGSSGEVLSSSTGPLHIAHAAGRPVTGLYPEFPKVQSFKRWRPDGYWHSAPVRWQHL